MSKNLKENLISRGLWTRALHMILFAITYSIAGTVMAAIVVVQFLFVLFTGHRLPRLLSFGEGLAVFIYQVLRFLTFNTEDKPFPFGNWPGESPRIEGRN